MVQSIAAAQAANPDARKKALALIPGTVDVDALFDWAEYKFPELFPAAGGMRFNLAYQGVNYRLRYYSTGNYLGLTDNDAIWGLGPFTDNQLMKIGMLSDYAQRVVDDQCKVYPGSSGCSTGITGPLNECAHPSTDALPTGLRSHLVYQYSGTLTGEQTLDTVIDGPGYDFQGKSRIRISTTSSGTTTVEGFPVTTTNNIKTFHIIQDGVARTLGSLVDLDTVTIGIAGAPALGTITSSLTVFEPPRDNWEFRLALGETATVATTTVTTEISPPGPTLTARWLRDRHLREQRKRHRSGRHLRGLPLPHWRVLRHVLPPDLVHLGQGRARQDSIHRQRPDHRHAGAEGWQHLRRRAYLGQPLPLPRKRAPARAVANGQACPFYSAHWPRDAGSRMAVPQTLQLGGRHGRERIQPLIPPRLQPGARLAAQSAAEASRSQRTAAKLPAHRPQPDRGTKWHVGDGADHRGSRLPAPAAPTCPGPRLRPR